MRDSKRNLLAGGVAASLALTAAGAGAALAADAPQRAAGAAAEAAAPAGSVQAATCAAAARAAADPAAGAFAFDQATLTPNAAIARTFRPAAKALCNAADDLAQVNPLGWELSVTGDVDNEFTAAVDELAGEESVSQTMTCTCGGNPADGRATFTADVKGIPVSYLLDRAGARAGVNALTFVSSDGTEVALPLSYVVARHGVISYELNGEDLSASVGGGNQLWLAGAPANVFVRDVVEVRVTREDVLPPEPGEGVEYPNSPNVGVLSAQVG